MGQRKEVSNQTQGMWRGVSGESFASKDRSERVSKDLKHALTNLGQMALVFAIVSVLLMCGLLANQAGWFGQAEETSRHGNSVFMLEVAASGESVYTGAEAVSEELREEIMDRVYPTPDAAIEAVVGPFPGHPASAHAVCFAQEAKSVSSRTRPATPGTSPGGATPRQITSTPPPPHQTASSVGWLDDSGSPSGRR